MKCEEREANGERPKSEEETKDELSTHNVQLSRLNELAEEHSSQPKAINPNLDQWCHD
jgi:hypothetical protein